MYEPIMGKTIETMYMYFHDNISTTSFILKINIQ